MGAMAASEMFYKLLIVVFLAVSLYSTPSDGQKKKEVSGCLLGFYKMVFIPHIHELTAYSNDFMVLIASLCLKTTRD